uniref:Uncharacterized protein n=1 Tax=Triticum urartu TaxID=4572 RepID=A0A8R7TWC1_TRIUA
MFSRDCITDLDNNRPFFTMHACIAFPYCTEVAAFMATSAAEKIVGLGARSTSCILQHRFITSQCIPFRDKPLINRLHVRRFGRVFVSSISLKISRASLICSFFIKAEMTESQHAALGDMP